VTLAIRPALKSEIDAIRDLERADSTSARPFMQRPV